jgi:hypothetical protein
MCHQIITRVLQVPLSYLYIPTRLVAYDTIVCKKETKNTFK